MRPVYLSSISAEFGDRVPVADLADPALRPDLELLAGEGIRHCRVTSAAPVDLAVASASRTVRAGAPDAIVYCSDSPGQGVPAAIATRLGSALRLPGAPVTTVGGGGCGNLGPGLRVARGLLVADELSSVLLVTADRVAAGSRYLPDDLTVLSDGAASCLVTTSLSEPGFRVLAVAATVQADLPEVGGLSAARAVVAGVGRATRHALDAAGRTPRDFRHVVTGNYGDAVRGLLTGAAGFPRRAEYAPAVADLGHCFAADALVGLAALVADGGLANGDCVGVLATSQRAWTTILLEYTV